MSGIAAAALAATAMLVPAGATDGDVTLTFDWPLECAVGVTQTYVDSELTIDVAYDATAEQRNGVVVVEFADATVTATDGVGDDLEAELAAFFTNPTIEVEADGSPVEAVGFEEWLEDFTASGAEGDEAQLEQEIVHRSASIVWSSWAGLWAELGSVPGTVLFEDVPYLDESLDEQVAGLDVVADVDDAGTVDLVAERSVGGRTTTITATGDPTTLALSSAGYEVIDGDDLVMAYEWAFDWPDHCDGPSAADAASTTAPPVEPSDDSVAGPGADVVVPPGFDTITYNELPPEALDTLTLIEMDGPFPYRQDGAVFQNREGILPDQFDGYYQEYTVETPGSDDRGARRIVTGEGGEVFYTDDHYDSFQAVIS